MTQVQRWTGSEGADLGAPRGGPILVTGAHRSGTSWIGSMLAASATSPVTYLDEPFNLDKPIGLFPDRLPFWFGYVTPDNEAAVRRSVRDVLDYRYASRRELASVRSPRGLARLGRDRYRFQRARQQGARPLMKDPIAVCSAEWLADEFDMNVVVSIRHPAGFAGSLVRLGWQHPFDHFLLQPDLMRDHLSPFEDEIRWYAEQERPVLEQAALLWKLIYTVVDGYRQRRPDWTFVRLEDLASSPLDAFAHLYRRTGLVFDEAALQAVRDSSSETNPVQTAGASAIRRNSSAAVQSWRQRLDPSQVGTVRGIVGELADRFYPGDWP